MAEVPPPAQGPKTPASEGTGQPAQPGSGLEWPGGKPPTNQEWLQSKMTVGSTSQEGLVQSLIVQMHCKQE